MRKSQYLWAFPGFEDAPGGGVSTKILPKYYQIYGFCGVNFLLCSIIFYEFHSRFLPGLVDMDFNQPRLVKGHGKACHIC